MADVAIRVENLSKQYRIGALKNRHDTLRDQLVHGLKGLFGGNRHPAQGERTIWAVKDVSFQIKRGEVVGIVGRNGAGKSTLLKMLSRITEPTTGYGDIHGRVGSLLEVGTGFHPELTGRENIYLNGVVLGMKKDEIQRKFDEIVAFAEIEKFLDTPVKRYSSGMYVRLAFAVAAHLEPDILLIDEVLSVGDLRFQRKCLEHARRLQKKSATVIIVSHNMFTIRSMCVRAIYLSDGRVGYDGRSEDALAMYENDNRLEMAPWAEHVLTGTLSEQSIHFTSITLMGEDGQRRRSFRYGERMRIRLAYRAVKELSFPNFCVGFIRSDNVGSSSCSSSLDGMKIRNVKGEGTIELLTAPLKLTSDQYSIHAGVWDENFERVYCAQVGPTFHVANEILSRHFGVVYERGEWIIVC
jgi:lipopolysaccharide transport system ATP-binding protein